MLFFGLLLGIFYGQTTVASVVHDNSTNEILLGVTIYANQSKNNAGTNINGLHSLAKAAGDDSLSFSFIGYVAQRVAIANRSAVDIR